MRLAKVWMDEYADVFLGLRPSLTSIEYGDLEQRKIVRETLKCKPFKWFLDTLLPGVCNDMPNSNSLSSCRLTICLMQASSSPRTRQSDTEDRFATNSRPRASTRLATSTPAPYSACTAAIPATPQASTRLSSSTPTATSACCGTAV